MIIDIKIPYFNNCPQTTKSVGRKRYTRIKPADLLDKINKVNVVKLIG